MQLNENNFPEPLSNSEYAQEISYISKYVY